MSKLIYLVAGEPSGDLLGAKLMSAIRAQLGDEVRFAGVGGEQMEAQGLKSLFPMQEISLIGFAEILPHLTCIFKRLAQTVADIKEKKPAVVVTIDSPGFNCRIAKKLKDSNIPFIHYVAPTVWAYRPERAAKMAKLFDHLMVLLPFEKPYFDKVGLPCTFVGHPVVEGWEPKPDKAEFLKAHGIAPDAPKLCVLPGSRPGEIKRHLPVFVEAIRILAKRFPRLVLVFPTVREVADTIREELQHIKAKTVLVDKMEERKAALSACDAALAKSGTVTLELAMAGVPMVVTYRVSRFSAWMMRRMIRVRFVNLLNLIMDREIVPELLQEFCQPELLADEVGKLLAHPEARAEQRADYREALGQLGLDSDSAPSMQAAKVVCGYL